MSTQQKTVLFVCSGNAARSQMAEAILRSQDSVRFQAFSAGTQPRDALDPRTVQVLEKMNLSTEGLYPKSLAHFADQTFDFIIT
ncbi:MAG: hypothetical protein VXW65_14645, partial [Pseudomonadota bacterium]|nr:hypothetical protein [Pseudomonadota bacterium]